MGGLGSCCCECCGELTPPTEWDAISSCCAECRRTLTDEWTNICTDPIRTDTRTAYVGVRMYTREITIITDPIQCVEDPPGSGIFVCTVGGVALDECPADALCGTTTYEQTTTSTLKLVARWKRTNQSSTLSRVLMRCEAEPEETCKWLLVSRVCITIEWGYKWFIDDEQEVISDSACCHANDFHTTVTAPSCATAAAEMYIQNVTNVCLTRSKYYTSEPTGVVTLNPGDDADDNCEFDIDDVCSPVTYPITSVDTDEVVLTSVTSSDAIPWTAPACVTDETTEGCAYVYKPNAGNCTNAVLAEDLSHPETRSTVSLTGSLLGPLAGVYPIQFDSACQGPDICTDFITPTRMECIDLASSQSDSGHTNRSITITLPAWTVDLGSCDDA